MLDHAGFPVSDYKRSKAFYEKALAPLGYVLVMEVPQTENDTPAAGFTQYRGGLSFASLKAHRLRFAYNFSFRFRCPSVRSRSALSLMKPSASRWS